MDEIKEPFNLGICEIFPKEKIADILFNMSEEDLINLGYSFTYFDELLNWREYEKNQSISCYFDLTENAIATIVCWKSAVYNKHELIGLSSKDLIKILGEPDEVGEPVWVSDTRQQTPWQYYDLCLQVWFENDRTQSIYCDSSYDEI